MSRLRSRSLVVLCLVLLGGATACGGGGGGGSDPLTFYVRANGNDGNDGESPERALRSIRAAVIRARGGDTILVGPGAYFPPPESPGIVVDITAKTASASRPLLIRADTTGLSTNDPAGEVVLDVDDGAFGVRITGSSGIIVDGFTVRGTRGANAAGVQVRSSSSDVIVRNCIIVDNTGDGLRVESSDRTLIFNNLIYENSNRGIQVAGSTSADTLETRLINNTVANNGNDGISVGGGIIEDTQLRNNLLYDNAQRGIDVDADATRGYDADYNLLFPVERDGISVDYGISTPKGLNDVSQDPLFVGFFRLAQESAGDPLTSPAVDAGAPDTSGELRQILLSRTTATSDMLDIDSVDIGFHFTSSLEPEATPTPTATAPGTTPPPAPTATRPPITARVFVRQSGDDTNTGATPALALRTIQEAVKRAAAGIEIVVGPGTYAESVQFETSGTEQRPIILRADPTGALTGDAAGSVVVTGAGARALFVDGAKYWTIDGFQITGASIGIHVRRQATGTVLRHNEIFGNTDDGIRIQDTVGATVFDNLVYCNRGAGVLVAGSSGSPDSRVINNTVVSNGDRGLFFGSSGGPSNGATLRNNLLQGNCGNNLQVTTSSVSGYDGRYNLVSPPSYQGIDAHPTDTAFDETTEGVVDRPAGFVAVALCPSVCSTADRPAVERHADDFRLAQTIAGQPPPDGLGVDAGDPTLSSEFRAPLTLRTTATNHEPDGGRVDIGYHYPR